MFAKPSPKLSRRWPVTSSIGNTPSREIQRIDHRIAGDYDLAVQRLALEVRLRACGGGEHQIAHQVDHATIHFFRPRLHQIAGAQTRFDMPDRNPPMKCGERRSRGGRRIAVDQHAIRLHGRKHVVERRGQARGQSIERLVARHQREIVIRCDLEQIQHLIEHLLMLTRDADNQFDAGVRFELFDQRRHLDGFRPCTEYRQNLRWHMS